MDSEDWHADVDVALFVIDGCERGMRKVSGRITQEFQIYRSIGEAVFSQ